MRSYSFNTLFCKVKKIQMWISNTIWGKRNCSAVKTTIAESLGSVPSTCLGCFTVACNSSFRMTLWPLRVRTYMVQDTILRVCMCTYTILNKLILKTMQMFIIIELYTICVPHNFIYFFSAEDCPQYLYMVSIDFSTEQHPQSLYQFLVGGK